MKDHSVIFFFSFSFIHCNATGPISSMEIAQLNIILSGVTVQAIFSVRIHDVLGSSKRSELSVQLAYEGPPIVQDNIKSTK